MKIEGKFFGMVEEYNKQQRKSIVRLNKVQKLARLDIAGDITYTATIVKPGYTYIQHVMDTPIMDMEPGYIVSITIYKIQYLRN